MDVRWLSTRAFWTLFCTWPLLVLHVSFARAQESVTAPELLYLAQLACVLGPALALVTVGLAALDRSRFGQRAARAGLVVAALALPLALPLGAQLALAEGLRAKGVPPALLHAAGTSVGVFGLVAGWAFQRFVRTPAACLALGVPCALALAYATERLGVEHQASALWVLAALAILVAHGVHRLGECVRGVPRRLPHALTAALLLVAMAGVLAPDLVAHGRRRAVVKRSPIALLDVATHAFGTRFVGYAPPEGGPRPCSQVSPTVAEAALALSAAQRRNVLIVTIDTLRLDDATRSVQGRPLMPHLARFLRESWSAPHAVTGYPATMMALSSAFSGLLPSRLTLTGGPPPSIFGKLQGKFDDVSTVLPSQPYFKRPPVEPYIVQGATRVVAQGKADQTLTAITRIRSLRAQHKRHLTWLHYVEPHDPYTERKGFEQGPSDRDRYRSELAFVDHKLGQFFDALTSMRAFDDTLVLLFSDHGESFGELGHAHHHYHLYPWLVRVPFGMRVPGQKPRRFEGPVHLTDVAATVYDFAGVSPPLQLDGRSLFRTAPGPERVLLSEEFPMQSGVLGPYATVRELDQRELARRIEQVEHGAGYASKVAVMRGNMQLVVHRNANVHELFDLAKDPGVEHDLSEQAPSAASSLRDALADHYRRVNPWLGCTPSR